MFTLFTLEFSPLFLALLGIEVAMFLLPGLILTAQWRSKWLERTVGSERMTIRGFTAKRAFFVHAIFLELLWTIW